MRHLAVLLLLFGIVVSQEKATWATIPASHILLLYESTGLAIVAWFVLRSGWGRPETHAAEQRAMGMVSNDFYPPRREGISSAVTLVGGMAGAMWWGATAWLTLARGMERHQNARGLVSLEVSVLVGVLAGGIAGAALGLVVGELWERRHRARRRARSEMAPER